MPRNSFYDLGFDHEELTSRQNVNMAIEKLALEFDLVMILEKFDESLVLLKYLNCWTDKDVMYAVSNKNVKLPKPKLSPKAKDILRKALSYEYDLYNFFRRKMDKEVRYFGRVAMQAEIDELKGEIARFKRNCKAKRHDREDCHVDPGNFIFKNCPCNLGFDKIIDCQTFNVNTDMALNQWSKCIQDHRLGLMEKEKKRHEELTLKEARIKLAVAKQSRVKNARDRAKRRRLK